MKAAIVPIILLLGSAAIATTTRVVPAAMTQIIITAMIGTATGTLATLAKVNEK